MNAPLQHLVIIGNGIAGVTVARHVRKMSNMRITIISAESRHFFSRPALMYIFMGHMRYENTKPYEDTFWEKNRIELLQAGNCACDIKNPKGECCLGDVNSYVKATKILEPQWNR